MTVILNLIFRMAGVTKILNFALKMKGVVGRVAHAKSSDSATLKKFETCTYKYWGVFSTPNLFFPVTFLFLSQFPQIW